MQSTYETTPVHRSGQASDVKDQVMEAVQHVSERAAEVADDAVGLVKQHPYTTLAVAAGLAFAVGALWKMQSRPHRSQLDQLLARVPDLPSASALRSYWR